MAGGTEVNNLFFCLGRTGAPSILPFLRATVEQCIYGVTLAALGLSHRNADAQVNGLLRDLMVREDLAMDARDMLFAELARRGDAAAIPLFPRAYELGLYGSSRESVPGQLVGVQWLTTFFDGLETRKLYGFDDAQLTAAWRAVLAGPAVMRALADASGINRGLPRVALQPLAEAVLAHIDQLAEAKLKPNDQNWQRRLLALVAGMVTDSAEDAPVRAILARLCAHPQWGCFVLAGLDQPQVIAAMADDLRKLLGGPNGLSAMGRLNLGGIALTKDELLTCLRNQDGRRVFVEQLRPDAPPEVVHEVVAMLKVDGDASLRFAACTALGRFLSADSVPALLPMLRDPDATVVKAATEALDKIRQYQEQKAYWDQFQAGITTGRESATAKLLIQGKPGAPKEQRVLALRSLAALGAPEALPYLIEWTHDADAEVAQAAKDAIGTIHQHAGVK